MIIIIVIGVAKNIEGGDMHKTIDALQARKQLGGILDEVYYSKEPITIERKGKAMAALVPIEFLEQSDQQVKEQRKALKNSILDKIHDLPSVKGTQDPVDMLKNLRNQRTEKLLKKYGTGAPADG